jgi:pimeloyl-ACP methyl ester carboxylesterase
VTALTGLPQTSTLRTEDGVAIDACHDPAASGGRDLAVVVAHGFTGSWRRPAVRRVAALLSGEVGGVVSFDFRGHGRSGGVSTVGDLEVLDLQAAVAWTRELGYARVATLGFSMGASVVVRHAGLYGRLDGGVVAVAAVSGPARWYYRGTPAMRRTHWVIERPVGRLVSRVALRTRISPAGWDPVPAPPHDWSPGSPRPRCWWCTATPTTTSRSSTASSSSPPPPSPRSCGSRPASGTPRTPHRTNCFDASAAGSPPRPSLAELAWTPYAVPHVSTG